MSAKVIYKDVALGAAESAVIETSTALESFSDKNKITTAADLPGIATCELNGWGLSHEYNARAEHILAFWSKERSGADCLFSSAPSLSITFPERFTTTGITVRFAPGSYDFCKQCHIEFWDGATLKSSGDFDVSTPVLVVNRVVEAFNKITFTFQKTNQPGKRCKIENIIIGVIRNFEADELVSVSAIHEINLINENLPVNVLDVNVHSKSDIDYIFQRKQPVEAFDGENLLGVYYIEKGKRTGGNHYALSCCDALGLLDLVTYDGGIWIENTPLRSVLASVFGSLFEFEIDPAFNNATLRGFIEPEKTMREALRQIAFALGAVVDTTSSRKIKLFPMPESGTAIEPRDTYIGGTVETSDKITEVTVTAYRFFDERPGEDDEFVELNGVQYRYYTETKHAYNPDVIGNDMENKVKFIGCYLCNLDNSQERANAIMDYYRRRDKYAFSHVLKGEKPADERTVFLPWGNTRSGNITKMAISMSGITISNSEMILNK